MEKFTRRDDEPEVEERPVFNGEEIPVFDPVELERSNETDDDADEDETDDEGINVNDR